MIHYDWSDGTRTATLDDGGRCVHRRITDEPISYTGWHEWAKRHARKHKQVKCPTSPGCPILHWQDAPTPERL